MRRGLPALVCVLAGTRGAAAEPCAPHVDLVGETAAVSRVAGELTRLGIALGKPTAGCAALYARVGLDAAGITVTVVDRTRRYEGRTVHDPALAAAWIDSWMQDELAWSGAPPVGPPAASAVEARPSSPSPRLDLLERGSLAFGYEQMFSNEAASWHGYRGEACVRVGAWCAGVAVRYVKQADGSAERLTSDRSDLSALATVGAPLVLGRLVAVPTLAAGIGRYTSDRGLICQKSVPDPTCDAGAGNCATDPTMCAPGETVDDVLVKPAHAVSYRPRLEATLRIAVPLFAHVWLEGHASFAYAPGAHTAPFAPDSTTQSDAERNKLALPGEPSTMAQLGVGLRVGAP